MFEPEEDHSGWNPPEVEVPKGRSRTKRPNRRDKSDHDHLGLGGQRASTQRRQASQQRQNNAQWISMDHFPYCTEIEDVLLHYVTGYREIIGDGNYGF